MNVQELRPFECIRLIEGTGDSTICVIKGDRFGRIYITQEESNGKCQIARLDETSSGNNAYVYQHFSKSTGEKYNTLEVITRIKNKSRDWYVLLLCECVLEGLKKQ